MCTVTFMARRNGYCLGMNRDEKLVRPTGLAPRKQVVSGRVVVCPSEPGGGTWIALNDGGACLALVNWYSVAKKAQPDSISRGVVVQSVSSTFSPGATDGELRRLPLRHINPFRLIGIFPVTHEIIEWRWDLNRLIHKRHSWKAQQWISSGFDERTAQRVRGSTFRNALRERSAGRLDWLRRLHGSHVPQCGPFSTCMHRTDAATVSYTEVVTSSCHAAMSYQSGAPCKFPNISPNSSRTPFQMVTIGLLNQRESPPRVQA